MNKQQLQHLKLVSASASLVGFASTCWLKNTASWLARLNYHIRKVEEALPKKENE